MGFREFRVSTQGLELLLLQLRAGSFKGLGSMV